MTKKMLWAFFNQCGKTTAGSTEKCQRRLAVTHFSFACSLIIGKPVILAPKKLIGKFKVVT